MKRDMDLVRAILIEIEKAPFEGRLIDVEVAGRTEDEISYHVLLMQEAGLVDAIDLSDMKRICWKPKRLTDSGHEFLEAARNDTMWAKAKDKVMSTTGTLTLEALKIALGALIKQALTGGM
jgi:hypothetical protein